jgi:hypothetical protein
MDQQTQSTRPIQPRCPNCNEPVEGHASNSCVLNAFIQLLADRDTLTPEQLRELHTNTDVDQMWGDLGPALDRLEAGFYSQE